MKGMYILDADMLNAILKVLNCVYHEARFRFENGLHVRVADDTFVAMVAVDVPKDAFYEYNGDITVGVEIHRLYSITSKLNGKIEMSIDENKLRIVSGNMEYSYAVLDPSAMRREPKEPKLEFTVKAEVPRKDFISVLKLASKISDTVSICCDGILTLQAEGGVEKISAELGEADDVNVKLEKDRITSRYNVHKLLKFLNACNGNVTLQFADNYPLCLTSELHEAEVRFYLAPVIEVE